MAVLEKVIIERMRKSMSKYRQVRAVYLFGSTATGKTGKLSDIDIAVLLKEMPDAKTLLALKLDLISEFSGVFGSDRIDFVLLNDAAPLVAFEVISKGQLVYGKRKDVAEFEANVSMQYHDIRYYYDKYAEVTINRVAEKGLR